jgi:hypothetical protein
VISFEAHPVRTGIGEVPAQQRLLRAHCRFQRQVSYHPRKFPTALATLGGGQFLIFPA